MEENSQQPPVATAEAQAPVQSVAPHRGVLILVLGILGIVCCICGIIAWVMGNNDMRKMDAGRMDPTGRGLTQAGKICGMVGVILDIVGIVINVIFMLLGLGFGLFEGIGLFD